MLLRFSSPGAIRLTHSRGLLFDPDTGTNNQGGGAPGGSAAGGTSNGGAAGSSLPQEAIQGFQNLLTRHQNDAIRLAETLYSENHASRQRISELQGQLPAQGAVVLSAEDAQRWQAYTALGELATVQANITAGATAQQDLASLRRDLLLRDVSDASGFDREALTEIGGSWEYVIKDEQVDGKAAKVVYVKDGDKETKLADHPKVQKFMAVLKPQAPAAGAGRGTPAGQQRQQTAAAQGSAAPAPRRSSVRL